VFDVADDNDFQGADQGIFDNDADDAAVFDVAEEEEDDGNNNRFVRDEYDPPPHADTMDDDNGSGGDPDNDGDDSGDNDAGAAAVVPPRYSLRSRDTGIINQFRSAIDDPHSSQSYFPPTHFFQCAAVPDSLAFVVALVFTQMTTKAGIRKHGKVAKAFLMKEFAQLEDLKVYHSVSASSLTHQQQRDTLRAVNLIEEKRDGSLKGRTCADSRRQRTRYDKAQTTSQTVSSDSLIVSVIDDTYDDRDVGTADIAGAYLKADMDNFAVNKFTGEAVRILRQMNPAHKANVVNENVVDTLYAVLDKALYRRCVNLAQLWYNLLASPS
jgi:hypothetical protein